MTAMELFDGGEITIVQKYMEGEKTVLVADDGGLYTPSADNALKAVPYCGSNELREEKIDAAQAEADFAAESEAGVSAYDSNNPSGRADTPPEPEADDDSDPDGGRGIVPNELEEAAAEAADEPDATPAASEAAAEAGIDLSEVEGSGKDGRIVLDDVKAAEDERDDADE